VSEWKWEQIAMDFIVGLLRTQLGYYFIWVIMDQLTKVAHFIPIKTTYSAPQLAELYMLRIVYLHGVPKKIVSNRGSRFTLKFWERLHEYLGYPIAPQFYLSSSDRWSDQKSQSDFGRYVESLCPAIWKVFG
jgi:hypothetical protein